MLKMRWMLLFFALLSILWAPAYAEDADTPRYRALLLACDEFVHFTDTHPTGKNNLQAMQTVLAADTRGFSITAKSDGIYDEETLRTAIAEAFDGAKDGDISYIYISTHGVFDPNVNNPEGELVLSNGESESRVSAQMLQAMLDRVPGEKVLFVDACNSGALIEKGISPSSNPERMMPTFQNGKYRVLTSSGGSEKSYYWNEVTDASAPLGSSYFTTALAGGAGLYGEYASDNNRDGTITMNEMYRYLGVNFAASTPQMYPQEDDFPLITYDVTVRDTPPTEETLSNIIFGQTVLTEFNPSITFEFTAPQPVKLGYQLIYSQGGRWDWDHPSDWSDTEDTLPGGVVDGTILSGRKTRKITLPAELDPTSWGYVMLNLIVDPDGGTRICASRILSIQPLVGNPRLNVKAADTFEIGEGRELPIMVEHDFPCTLTVSIYNEAGDRVRKIATSQPSRPQGLTPPGSLFYWTGLDDAGNLVPPGTYTVKASTRIGGMSYVTGSTFTVR